MTTNERSLLISHDMAQAIEHGARYLATLAALERAHMLGDEDELASIFDGIDPIDVRLTANVLQSLSFLWHAMPPVRGGTDGAPVDSGVAAVSPLPPSVTAAGSPPDGEQPSAPIIPIPLASRKAPCS